MDQPFPWHATPIGDPTAWSEALRTVCGLVRASPQPMLVWWGPAHLQIHNAAFGDAAGISEHASLGRPAAEAWPAGWARFGRDVAAMLDGAAAPAPSDLTGLLPDGTAWQMAVSPIPQGAGIGSVLLVCTERALPDGDADRRALAAELAEERRRLAFLIDHLPVGVNLMDRDGRTLVSNPAFRHFLLDGVIPSRNPTMLPRWTALAPDGRALRPDEFPGARSLRGEAVPGIECLYRPPPDVGPEKWLRVSGVPLRDPAGELTGALTVIVDIDAEKRAREALQRLNDTLEARISERTAALAAISAERTRLASVTEASPTGIAIWDLDLRGLYLNPAGRRLLGIPPETSVADLGPADYVVPEERAKVLQDIVPAALAAGRWTGELMFRHATIGDPIAVFQDLFRIDDPETGAPTHLAAIVRDLRERRQAEEMIRQAQKMEAVGQLTGGLAHDFNNLLTAVLGNLELLEAGLGPDDTLRKRLVAATRAARRGAKLTAQLLAFSRRQHLASRPVDLNAAVIALTEMLSRTLGGTVTVETALAPELWPALVDATQLEVALLNLAVNARDAMPNGGTVLITTRNVARDAPDRPNDLPEGPFVAVSVADTGGGMSPDVIEKAFEPFFTTKEVGRGTGLGLSQVYGLARQSGGTVRLHSRPAQGTTVEIFLPRSDNAAASHEAPLPATRTDPAAVGTVLIVDDEDDVADVAAAHLQSLGYATVRASSGRAAIERLAADGGAGIDVLLVDFALPQMRGNEVIAAARAMNPALACVLMTGYADTEALEAGLLRDVVLLNKPFRLQALQAAIVSASRGPAESG